MLPRSKHSYDHDEGTTARHKARTIIATTTKKYLMMQNALHACASKTQYTKRSKESLTSSRPLRHDSL